jgi:hypothetical protein
MFRHADVVRKLALQLLALLCGSFGDQLSILGRTLRLLRSVPCSGCLLLLTVAAGLLFLLMSVRRCLTVR